MSPITSTLGLRTLVFGFVETGWRSGRRASWWRREYGAPT